MDRNNDSFDSLVEALGPLLEMQEEDNDRKAVVLYRAMFVNDKDINKLDFNYADHILEYAEFGCENAIVDYNNYLNYLKTIVPKEYPSHLQMFQESMKRRNEEERV